jgi:uncharacterized protein (TIGR00269 family)
VDSPAHQRDGPACSACGEPAVFFQRHTGRHLCGRHLIEEIERNVEKTITSRRMICPGDRVAVALSGGKDSTALLLILNRLLASRSDVRLVAITIDEGIHGYREDTIQSAEQLVSRFGIENHCISFLELFGGTLDKFLKDQPEQACSICGILRRKALIVGAEKAGATKLATGHNLDDEAQSVFMNVLRGDLPRLVRDTGTDSSGLFIPRIKPLSCTQEKEIAAYLLLSNAWNDLPECPYAVHALRREARSILATLEYRYPGTMLNLMKSKKKIESACIGKLPSEPIRRCQECGDPCSGDLCQLCRIRHMLSG